MHSAMTSIVDGLLVYDQADQNDALFFDETQIGPHPSDGDFPYKRGHCMVFGYLNLNPLKPTHIMGPM